MSGRPEQPEQERMMQNGQRRQAHRSRINIVFTHPSPTSSRVALLSSSSFLHPRTQLCHSLHHLSFRRLQTAVFILSWLCLFSIRFTAFILLRFLLHIFLIVRSALPPAIMSPVIRATTATLAGMLNTISSLSGGSNGPAVTSFNSKSVNILPPLPGPNKVGVVPLSVLNYAHHNFPLCDVGNDEIPDAACQHPREIMTSVL